MDGTYSFFFRQKTKRVVWTVLFFFPGHCLWCVAPLELYTRLSYPINALFLRGKCKSFPHYDRGMRLLAGTLKCTFRIHTKELLGGVISAYAPVTLSWNIRYEHGAFGNFTGGPSTGKTYGWYGQSCFFFSRGTFLWCVAPLELYTRLSYPINALFLRGKYENFPHDRWEHRWLERKQCAKKKRWEHR